MNSIYSQKLLSESIKRVLLRINSLRSSLKNLVWSSKEGLLIHTNLQAIFNIKYESDLDRLIHEFIMIHAIKSEKFSSGGFDTCLEFLFKGFSLLEIGTQLNNIKNSLSISEGSLTHRPCKTDIDWLIETYMQGSSIFVKDIFLQAINLSGFNGNIIVDRAANQIASVEVVRGYKFHIVPGFKINVKLESPRIFCIDGYIETVSEINHLLESASQTKDSILLFVRGLSDDVKHTLKVNYDRGTLKVIPIEVKFDIDGINTMADICIVTGSSIVSADKGDLISSTIYSEAPIIEAATIYSKNIMLYERSTQVAVAIQTKKLRKKRDKAEYESIAKIFDERLHSLTPNHVSIRLLDDRNYVQNTQYIDYTLRAFKSLLSHGTCVVDNEQRLSATIVAGTTYALKCLETLNSAGCALVTS